MCHDAPQALDCSTGGSSAPCGVGRQRVAAACAWSGKDLPVGAFGAAANRGAERIRAAGTVVA